MKVGGYEIERELGRGGMGVVYLARDPRLDRPVALKLMLGQSDPEGLARFQREAEALGALDHPGVVSVHGAGEDQGRPFLVLEYVGGPSLAQVLRRDGPLPPARAARVVADVARGVAHAHAKGILHRDIKPDNVLVDDRGQARLTDFGLARVAQRERLTETGSLLGTPEFMAPEQASGEVGALGPLTDVYGLGALLHALLAGEAPFGGQTLANVLSAVLTLPPRPLPRDVPEDLRRICRRGLAKRPADRYPSADALADALERFLQGAPADARGARGLLLAVSLALAGAAVAGVVLTGQRTVTPAVASPSATPRATPRATPAPRTTATPTATPTPARTPAATPTPAGTPAATPTPAGTPAATSALQEDARLISAELMLSWGEHQAALESVEQVLAAGPRADAHLLRGRALVALGGWSDGIPDFEAAAELAGTDRTRAEALRKLSTALRMTAGRREEALPSAERACELAPDHAGAWDVLAHARSVHGDWAGALAAWNTSLKLDPSPHNRADILRNRGRALHVLRRHEEALEDFRESYEVDPKPLTLLLRARTLEQLSRPRLALEDLQRALRGDPDVGGESTQDLLQRLEQKVARSPSPAEVDPHR